MIDTVRKNDVPKRYEDMLEAVGLEGFKNLVSIYGGTTIYIPTYKKIIQSSRNQRIKDDFDGDYDKTAKKYNISRTQAYNIINNL